MLKTHIVMSLLIFCFLLLLVLCLVSFIDNFVPTCFGHGPHSQRGDCPPCRHNFPIGGSYTHFEPRHLDDPHFPCRGSCLTGSNDEMQKTVKTSSGRMVKCWISKFYLTNPALSHRPSLFLCR
jgi:hypothetical protein